MKTGHNGRISRSAVAWPTALPRLWGRLRTMLRFCFILPGCAGAWRGVGVDSRRWGIFRLCGLSYFLGRFCPFGTWGGVCWVIRHARTGGDDFYFLEIWRGERITGRSPHMCPTVGLMAVSAGRHKIGADRDRLIFRTARDGIGASVGHDLVIEVTRWSGELDVNDDGTPATLDVKIDLTSLAVREGTGGGKPL